MFAGQGPRQNCGLRGTGDSRQDGPHRPGEPIGRQAAEMRRVGTQHFLRETYNIQEQQRSGHEVWLNRGTDTGHPVDSSSPAGQKQDVWSSFSGY